MSNIRHIISIDDYDMDFLESVIARASWTKHNKERSTALAGQLLISMFFEPSTRTRLSFEAAMCRLGGSIIGTENAGEFSSFAKGESIADTFKVISGYGDVIVGRFKQEGEARIAAEASMVPVINGGDGKGEHPTQALLDLYSIIEKFPDRKDLRITFVGDNKHSRTVHSLVKLLAKFPTIGVMNFVSPQHQQIPTEIIKHLRDFSNYRKLSDNIIKNTDILYVTRSQIERQDYLNNMDIPYCEYDFEYPRHEDYIVSARYAEMLPTDAIILAPLPRTTELPPEVDSNHRAYYFQQAHNGLYCRMALLEELLGIE